MFECTKSTAPVLDETYVPSDDEPFMNERQREYFRAEAVLRWKEEILKRKQVKR